MPGSPTSAAPPPPKTLPPSLRGPAALVALSALRLENRLVVIVETQPVEAFDDLVDGVLCGTLLVGIFDPQ